MMYDDSDNKLYLDRVVAMLLITESVTKSTPSSFRSALEERRLVGGAKLQVCPWVKTNFYGRGNAQRIS